MSEHGHPSWWSWLVVIGGCLATLMIAVAISIQTNQTALDRERMARIQGEQELCEVVAALDDSYREVPPTTATGMKVADSMSRWRADNCPPELKGN
jgi:hypothetical protein